MLRCALCRRPLDWLHGHAACLHSDCPYYGLNQAECCSGDTMGAGWVPTSDLASPSCRTDEPTPAGARVDEDDTPDDDETKSGSN